MPAEAPAKAGTYLSYQILNLSTYQPIAYHLSLINLSPINQSTYHLSPITYQLINQSTYQLINLSTYHLSLTFAHGLFQKSA